MEAAPQRSPVAPQEWDIIVGLTRCSGLPRVTCSSCRSTTAVGLDGIQESPLDFTAWPDPANSAPSTSCCRLADGLPAPTDHLHIPLPRHSRTGRSTQVWPPLHQTAGVTTTGRPLVRSRGPARGSPSLQGEHIVGSCPGWCLPPFPVRLLCHSS